MDGLANRCADRLPANCSVSRLAVFLALVTCIVLSYVTFDADQVEGLLVWIQDNKGQGAVLFLVVYILGVILMFPAMVMAMAAGAVFGIIWGTLLVWIGSSAGQTLAFVVGRYLLRELVVQYLSRQFPKWTAIDKALESEGWKLVTLLRLSPIAPWNVLNYALSVTSVPLTAYVTASSLAIIPYLLLFVYFGSLARNLADIFTGKAGLGTNTTIIMAIVSGLLMVGIVVYTTHVSRKAISSALVAGGDEQKVELAADPDVAELLRVNSSEMAAAAEQMSSPGSGSRASQQHAAFGVASLPRADIELSPVLGKSTSKPAQVALSHEQQTHHLLAKKHTPASSAEQATLLDRTAMPDSVGGVTKVHQRSSYAGGVSNGTSPLGIVAAARNRLSSFNAF